MEALPDEENLLERTWLNDVLVENFRASFLRWHKKWPFCHFQPLLACSLDQHVCQTELSVVTEMFCTCTVQQGNS